MPTTPADKIAIDAALVGRLIAAQFPQWSAMTFWPITGARLDADDHARA